MAMFDTAGDGVGTTGAGAGVDGAGVGVLVSAGTGAGETGAGSTGAGEGVSCAWAQQANARTAAKTRVRIMSVEVHDTTFDGRSGSLNAIEHPEFLKDPGGVKLHRVLRDPEITGDLLVRAPAHNHGQHFDFPSAQRVPRGAPGQHIGNGGGKIPSPLVHRANRFDQLL